MFIRRYIGTRDFYKYVLLLTIPIFIQNGITNFVNMLDNIMIGQLGTVEMTGVSVTNQLIIVFNLCIFGAVSGAGIFGSQFAGQRNDEGIRQVLRLKLILCVLLTAIGTGIFILFGDRLIGFYLTGEGLETDAAASLDCAKKYMTVMFIGLLPYSFTQAYSSTMRETGKTVFPMYAGIAAVVVNLLLNYILIFGKLGAPKLGVEGAAAATVISRFVELIIVVLGTHLKRMGNKYAEGLFKRFYIPRRLIFKVIVSGLPLMLNETMWAAGMAMLTQCYSVRGLNVVAAHTICFTFTNLFSVVFIAIGIAISIYLGQRLGAGDIDGAKESARKLIAFSVFVSVLFAVIFIAVAEIIPSFYNTSDEIKLMATRLMQISALAFPIDAMANASYFTIRSGGRVFITMLFDSVFVWVINIPAVILLVYYTGFGILTVYAISQSLLIIKSLIGGILVHSGMWAKKIV